MSAPDTRTLSPAMQAVDFWKSVGLELERIRLRQGYPSTYALYTRHRDTKPEAPSYNTLNDIEAGRPGYVDSVVAYCDVLGVSMTDLFRHTLGAGPALDADGVRIALAFQDDRTDPALRAGMMAMVRLLEQQATAAARAPLPAPAAAPPAATAGTPRQSPGRAKGARGPSRGEKK
jgi:hypothetical protein